MKQPEFPPGWDDERVRRVLGHYSRQTEEEAVAEDEAAFEDPTQTVMDVPQERIAARRGMRHTNRAVRAGYGTTNT